MTAERRTLLAPADLERAIAELGSEPDACLVCAAPAPARAFFRSGKTFWRCRSCELVFVHDIYPEFAQDVDYLDGHYELSRLVPAPRRVELLAEGLLPEIEPHRIRNRFLEIGCGQGQLLELVARGGWEVRGVDLLPELVRLAREGRGLDVRAGELGGAGFEPGTFDVVFASELIEHIVDPVAWMREVHAVLRPGGVAILRTGNARSWAARLRGADWWYYMFGGHMHIRFWSPPAARALAAAAGFERVTCRTRGFAFREAREMRGSWTKPFLKLAQAPLSGLAGPLGAGHRLRMTFQRAPEDARVVQ